MSDNVPLYCNNFKSIRVKNRNAIGINKINLPISRSPFKELCGSTSKIVFYSKIENIPIYDQRTFHIRC